MARERRRGGPPSGRRARSTPAGAGERVRRRLATQPEIELTEEELLALADDGIDPEDARRLARERREYEFDEASEHDRDTARDQLEGLVAEQEDDH